MRHAPAAFTAGLLNSWPIGFYVPARLVNDARRHGVQFRAMDVQHSEWDCTLEANDQGAPEIHLGLMWFTWWPHNCKDYSHWLGRIQTDSRDFH